MPVNVPSVVQQAPLEPQILSPELYLSFYDLESLYCVDNENHSVRLTWLLKLGLNVAPFLNRWSSAYKKQEVEDAWMHLLPQKRRDVECTAITHKYKTAVYLDSIPLRMVPSAFLPLSFYALERHYFKIPERNLTDKNDIMKKRTA